MNRFNHWTGLFLSLLTVIFSILEVPALHVYAAEEVPPSLTAQAALVMDADSGQVLFRKNPHEKLQPASITKIITGILVAESGDPKDKITMSQYAFDDVPRYSSHIALVTGEELSVHDAMYAMMLQSANDASDILAEYIGRRTETGIGGGKSGQDLDSASAISRFIGQMNALAQKVGAKNTHFTNPHGLIDADHYTTAYDMALLTRYGLSNKTFMQYFGGTTYEMPATNKNIARTFANQCEMLKPSNRYTYEGTIGGKVGYTEQALSTMVTVAKRGERTLICVLLKVSDPLERKFSEAAELLDFCFDNFKAVEFSPSQITTSAVSFTKEDKVVDEGTVSLAEPFRFYLPKHLDEKDYVIRYNYQPSMEQPDVFTPKVSIILNSSLSYMDSILLEQPLTYTSSAVHVQNPADDIAKGERAKQLQGFFLWVARFLVIAVILFVVIIFLVRYINLSKRKRRRKRSAAARQSSSSSYYSQSPSVPNRQVSSRNISSRSNTRRR